MTTENTYVCEITSKQDSLSVLAPNGRDCVIDLTRMDDVDLTSDEQGCVYAIIDESESREQYQSSLTIREMNLLVSVRDKISNFNSKQLVKSSAKQVHDGIARRTMGNGDSKDATEARLTQLANVVARTEQSYVMLVYDIPTSKNDVCPNPSYLLWWHGFRINLSCWVLPEKNLEHPSIQRIQARWRTHNIKFHVVKYDVSQREIIRGIARDNLADEIRRIHTSLIANIISADEVMKKATEEADSQKGKDKAESTRDNKVRSIIKKSQECFQAAVSCAEAFEESESVADLLQGLRSAIQSQAESFNALAETKHIKPAPVSF